MASKKEKPFLSFEQPGGGEIHAGPVSAFIEKEGEDTEVAPTREEREARYKFLLEKRAKRKRFKRYKELELKRRVINTEKERQVSETERQKKIDALEPLKEVAQTGISSFFKPIKRIPEIFEEERKRGAESIKTAISPPEDMSTLGRVGTGAMGALSYLYAPITAGTRALAGEPVRDTAKHFGVPDDIAEGMGLAAEIAPDLFLTGGVRSGFRSLAPKAVTRAEELGQGAVKGFSEGRDIPATVGGLSSKGETASLIGLGKIKDANVPLSKIYTKAEGIPFTERVSTKVTKDMMEASELAMKGNFDESKRITQEIFEKLGTGEIHPESLKDLLKSTGMTPEQFAKEYVDTMRAAGKTLGQAGALAKKLGRVFKGNPEVAKIFDDMAPRGRSIFDLIDSAWMKTEDFRRAIIVTQIATMVRNGIVSMGRLGQAPFDEALEIVFSGASKGEMLAEFKNSMNAFWSMYNRLSPSGRKSLEEIFTSSKNGAVARARLISAPVQEVAMSSKIANALNIFNKGQEYFFRKVAFEAKLRTLLARKGLNYSTINPKKIPKDMLEESVDHALDITMATMPKAGTVNKKIIDAWRRIPGLTTINPFPRFTFGNAMPFIWQHSPLGMLDALSPKAIRALASGDSKTFAKAASKAMVGTAMFMSAWHVRQSKHAGPKWYQIITGQDSKGQDIVVDMRPFAPYSTYLLLAEAMINPENIKPKDYAMAAIGLNRIAGTGLMAVDLFRSKSTAGSVKLMQDFVGKYMSSFSVPARTAKDIYAGINPEEAIQRDTRDNPITGPFLANIPGVSQHFPESVSPFKVGRVKAEAPLLRQGSGLSKKTLTWIEGEVARLGIDFRQAQGAGTGVPEADRLLSKYIAPQAEIAGSLLKNNRKYHELSRELKRIVWIGGQDPTGIVDILHGGDGTRTSVDGIFTEIRADARRTLVQTRPDLALRIKAARISPDFKKIIEKELGEGFVKSLTKGKDVKESLGPLKEKLSGEQLPKKNAFDILQTLPEVLP